ncbi:MAG: hypothetical protein K1X50_14555 [Candidatus Promineofilum sp.]|nr:hypothetical protein [Promineifilum sp.]MCW5863150.1 hypothetical protein [Anaerolineae bacterium]
MPADKYLLQSGLASAMFELDEAIKRLSRLDSSLTHQAISVGKAGTDTGLAIFVELKRYTDLLDDCRKQCLAIRKSLQYLSTRNASILVRFLNWQPIKETIDIRTSIRRLERMHAQLDDGILTYATSTASVLADEKTERSALAIVMFSADIEDLQEALKNIQAARALLIEAELLQISPSSNLPEQTWDFITSLDLRVLLARDYQELSKLIDINARKSALILCGSIMEATLVSVLKDIELNAVATYSRQFPKSQKQIEDWKLWELIAVAHLCKLIDEDTKRQADILRDYRNLIHPLVETRRATELDDELVQAQVVLLKRLLRILSRSSANV